MGDTMDRLKVCPNCGRRMVEYNHLRQMWVCLWRDCAWEDHNPPRLKKERTVVKWKVPLVALVLAFGVTPVFAGGGEDNTNSPVFDSPEPVYTCKGRMPLKEVRDQLALIGGPILDREEEAREAFDAAACRSPRILSVMGTVDTVYHNDGGIEVRSTVVIEGQNFGDWSGGSLYRWVVVKPSPTREVRYQMADPDLQWAPTTITILDAPPGSSGYIQVITDRGNTRWVWFSIPKPDLNLPTPEEMEPTPNRI